MLRRFIEKHAFLTSLNSPHFFKNFVRKQIYKKAKNDPERVHEMAIEILNRYKEEIKTRSSKFDFPFLYVSLAGKKVMPFGTAAGLDKNADALEPLSYIFGFQEIGTIVVNKREGNNSPRVFPDELNENIYNAQGFPSKGLDYIANNLKSYRNSGGEGIILANICGIPQDSDIDIAHSELEILVCKLAPHVDGFVWNPSSPNTISLPLLRTKESFKQSIEIIKKNSERKLSLVKMWPFEDEDKKQWLSLVSVWLENGGEGVVAVNTYAVPKKNIPAKEWGYQSAGVSGNFLQHYRQRAIKETREHFPRAFIIAAGGIDSSFQAYLSFKAGANALEGYTPYTFYGFGLIREISPKLKKKLSSKGFSSLQEFQSTNN
ncbi:MAG: hypothetical protein AABX73_00940, partial [Nanoarchaeota archaeon]